MKIDNFVNFGVQKTRFALFFAALVIFTVSATSVRAANIMSGGGFAVEASQADASSASRHLRDSVVRGYGAMHSAGAARIAEIAGGGYEVSAGFEHFGFEPERFRSIAIKRSGDSAFGFNEDAVWAWEIPARGGEPITVDIYIRLAPEYGQAPQKPSFTLAGPGINASAAATAASFADWEKLTIQGTPSSNSTLVLSVSGHSRIAGARFYIDDIAVARN